MAQRVIHHCLGMLVTWRNLESGYLWLLTCPRLGISRVGAGFWVTKIDHFLPLCSAHWDQLLKTGRIRIYMGGAQSHENLSKSPLEEKGEKIMRNFSRIKRCYSLFPKSSHWYGPLTQEARIPSMDFADISKHWKKWETTQTGLTNNFRFLEAYQFVLWFVKKDHHTVSRWYLQIVFCFFFNEYNWHIPLYHFQYFIS